MILVRPVIPVRLLVFQFDSSMSLVSEITTRDASASKNFSKRNMALSGISTKIRYFRYFKVFQTYRYFRYPGKKSRSEILVRYL